MLPNLPPPGYAAPLAAEDHPDQLRGDPDYMLTLARGLHVIRAFGTRRHPQTAAELSRRAALPRAVVQRCLHTLILLGIAEQHGRLYVLTPRILGAGLRVLFVHAVRVACPARIGRAERHRQ